MTDDIRQRLREKDRAVLRNILDGNDDVQKITSNTTLENHHVTYSFQKIEELGLVEVEKPDGLVERVVDGQKRVFQAPKKAELTDSGVDLVEGLEEDAGRQYTDMSHTEVVEKMADLEDRIEELENGLEVFRKQVQDAL